MESESDRVPGLLSPVEWRDGKLFVLDQTLLPGEVKVRELATAADVIDAIQRLVVRGAPAIGVCGAFGVVVGLDEGLSLDRVVTEIGDARPTAVNLRWAVERVGKVAGSGNPATARDRALTEALLIQREDQQACRLIGENGRAELSRARTVMTHCNAGRLATTGIGTALGVVYAMAAAGEPVTVIAPETRPLMQGARLTAWELTEAGIPVTVIPDTAVGAAIAGGKVDAVIVGCDRVAANGDTANKIGTYQLAVLAREHGVPFYVAGPMTSFDPATPTGAQIAIEQRDSREVRQIGQITTAPASVDVWNPAFDVTPARFVTAFITDAGVLRPPYDESIIGALARSERDS